jgi:hypothetical protein
MRAFRIVHQGSPFEGSFDAVDARRKPPMVSGDVKKLGDAGWEKCDIIDKTKSPGRPA